MNSCSQLTAKSRICYYAHRLSLTPNRLLRFLNPLGMASQAVLHDLQDHLAKVRVDPKLALDSNILGKVDGYITGMQQVELLFLK